MGKQLHEDATAWNAIDGNVEEHLWVGFVQHLIDSANKLTPKIEMSENGVWDLKIPAQDFSDMGGRVTNVIARASIAALVVHEFSRL